jgi:SRSO17 transposase
MLASWTRQRCSAFSKLSPWDADALLKLNREYAMEHLADPARILVADPTGFAKKGTKSVGLRSRSWTVVKQVVVVAGAGWFLVEPLIRG